MGVSGHWQLGPSHTAFTVDHCRIALRCRVDGDGRLTPMANRQTVEVVMIDLGTGGTATGAIVPVLRIISISLPSIEIKKRISSHRRVRCILGKMQPSTVEATSGGITTLRMTHRCHEYFHQSMWKVLGFALKGLQCLMKCK